MRQALLRHLFGHAACGRQGRFTLEWAQASAKHSETLKAGVSELVCPIRRQPGNLLAGC